MKETHDVLFWRYVKRQDRMQRYFYYVFVPGIVFESVMGWIELLK